METLYTIFHFIVAIGLLVAIHEFGHFWVARKMGVKVIRFSIGFGKSIYSYKKTPESTEYVLAAIPLGGYVKMVDEREGNVKEEDLPYAFNRQPLLARIAIVAAGPIFNLLLAFFLFWAVFLMGETGMRPIVGEIAEDTLFSEAGFKEGEEILTVNGANVPTLSEAMNLLFSSAMNGDQEINITVKDDTNAKLIRTIKLLGEENFSPEDLYKKMGLRPWSPELEPIIGKVLNNSSAELAGLLENDLVLSADGERMENWEQWVKFVRSRPESSIKLMIERNGVHIPIVIVPKRIKNEEQDFGRIGAGVAIPDGLIDSLRVHYSLSFGDACIAALEKTWFFSTNTLQMMGRMLMGKASVENLSGPISIAQFAGQSAEMGLVSFFKFLALVSISLGVLNLLPVPILDGGHLMFFFIEAIKGSPVPEKIQIAFQNMGMFLLMTLMLFVVFLDIERLFQ